MSAEELFIHPDNRRLAPNDRISIVFPDTMIPAALIGSKAENPPLIFEPAVVPFEFFWRSQAEGEIVIGSPLRPASEATLALAPDATDLTGAPLASPVPETAYSVEPFDVRMRWSVSNLGKRPRVALAFTHPVDLREATKKIFFFETTTRARVGVESISYPIDDWDTGQGSGDFIRNQFDVEPVEDLKAGMEWKLLVEGVTEVGTGASLDFPRVFPLGKVTPPVVDWVGAFHFAADQPHIIIKFDSPIDSSTASLKSIRVDPLVEELKVQIESPRHVRLNGKFDTSQRYRVTITPQVSGMNGLLLAAESIWGATFQPKQPSIVFPESEIVQRSALGLDFAFIQSNVGAATWQLAQIPLEKLPAVRQKLREFTLNARDPATGQTMPDQRGRGEKAKETTPLIPFFNLSVLAEGTIDASPENDEIQRRLQWRPPTTQPALNGPCLLEITAPGPDGALYGNRSIVWFTEVAATQKRSPTTLTIRVADFEKGRPLPNVKVIAASADNIPIDSAITGTDGLVSMPIDRIFPSKTGAIKTDHFLIVDGEKTYWLPASPERFSSGWSNYGSDTQGLRGAILTDRPLYRPGEELRVKGMIREYREGAPRLPNRGPVTVDISGGPSGAPVATLSSEISALGGWDVEWTVPKDIPLGHYYVTASFGGSPIAGNGWFEVEEFRKPLFSIQVRKVDAPPETDAIEVSSNYFHGAPNIGATVRWRSTWYSSDDWDYDVRFIDRHSENAPKQTYMAEAEGEAFLDREGRVRIELKSPFEDGAKRARCWVTWSVDVLSPEGQTLSAGTSHLRQLIPAAVGIATKEVIEPLRGLEVRTVATNEANEPIEGIPVEVVVFQVETKSVREQLAPQVVRYHNRSIFTEVAKRKVTSGETFVYPTDQTGPFVATARHTGDANAPMVSDRAFLTGESYASFPWEDTKSVKLELEKSSFVPGERAIVKLAAPEGGMAWVTVENREVLDSMLISVENNTARIEVPIKKSYAPSATVAVYLLTPAGTDRLPQERFGYVHLSIERPDLTLKITPEVAAEEVEPRAPVRGRVVVTSEGDPVPGAEVAIWVVDEAILQLGSWSLPNLLPLFLTSHPYSVTTFTALGSLVAGVNPQSLFHKGFVIGDGGEGDKGDLMLVRENFKPLAYFRGAVSTDDAGVATFEFEAPDNLTTWRVIAVGQTSKHQFGSGSSTFQVTKNLMIEPAFPRFVRTGDRFELRAVLRQRMADAARIRVTAEATGGITLLGESGLSVEAGRDAPAVVRLPARVDGAPGEARIFFRAEGPGANDAFDVSLPIVSPETTVIERIAGVLKQDTKLDFKRLIPTEWRGRQGVFRAAVSSSSYFTKMEGIPAVLDYPHGCLEQITSQLLTYTILGQLIHYLPDSEQRLASRSERLQAGLKRYESSLLADGMLPYWPGGLQGNAFVTISAAWLMHELREQGEIISETVITQLDSALAALARGQIESGPTEQTFALMVATRYWAADDDFRSAAESLYLRRERFSPEARAFLALALHQLNHKTEPRDQLLAELGGSLPDTGFDPLNFSSLTRAEALRIMAFSEIKGEGWDPAQVAAANERLLGLMESSADLSTQENFWTLLAFASLVQREVSPSLPERLFSPEPTLVSKNLSGVSWPPFQSAEALSQLTGRAVRQPITWTAHATFQVPIEDQKRRNRGLRLERMMTNLTDPTRTGSSEAPLKLGDELVISFRITTERLQHYLALEDPLPALLETVNPNIASVAAFYTLPETSDPEAWLSHSEMRDQVTRLYFDRLEPGTYSFRYLARVTSAGAAAWPSAQVVPMYDARFSGMSPPSQLHSRAD